MSATELPSTKASAAVVEDGLWSPSRRGLTVGLVLTITLVAFEALAISTIMPLVARELGGLALYGWVFTAFFLGSLLGIAIVGGVIDERGLALPLGVGLVLFGVGLIGGGLAPSMEVLVVARFVQGLGGGAVPPIAYVAIGRALPERLRPGMFATLSTAWVVPGIAGPAIAGSVAELASWRFVFLGLLPLIAVSGLMALRSLPAMPPAPEGEAERRSSRRRIVDAFLVVLGAGLVTAGLTSDQPPLLAALVVVGLVILLPAMRRLTPPGTLRLEPGIPAAVLLRGLLTCAFFAIDAYVSLALVEVRGLTATTAGIALSAATVSWTTGSWTQARLRRLGPERLARMGFAVVAVGIALTALVLHPAVPVWFAVPAFALTGYGMGLAYSQFAVIVLRDAHAQAQGSMSAGLSLSDALGTALGTGVAGAMIAAAPRFGLSLATGLAAAFALGTVLAALGFAVSPRLRRAN